MRYLVRPAPQVPGDLGAPALPGSKSHAQRALLLAAFVDGTSTLTGVTASDDVRAIAAAVATGGRSVAVGTDDVWTVVGRRIARGERLRCDVGESGTAARLLLPVVPSLGGELLLDGHERLRRRPMGAAIAALRAQGIAVDGEGLPLVAHGTAPRAGRRWRVEAATTTQAASGAMLAAALAGGGEVVAVGAKAGGYLELSAATLRAAGVEVTASTLDGGERRFAIGSLTKPFALLIPPDASSRAFVAAFAALRRLAQPGLVLPGTLAKEHFGDHPDAAFDGDLARVLAAGADERVLDGLAARPDGVPMLAAAAALRSGTTKLVGLASLRAKESDRLAAMATALRAFGVEADAVADTLSIRPGTAAGDATFPAEPRLPPDHRIVMAIAVLAAVHPGGAWIEHAEACAKSWPGFWRWLQRCAEVRAEA